MLLRIEDDTTSPDEEETVLTPRTESVASFDGPGQVGSSKAAF